jgi:ATP-independent RNA helicase DbpA
MDSFDTFGLSPQLLPGLQALGYSTPTPIQAQALPIILQGQDLIAQAPTGSGKTAAFGLGLLQQIDLAQTATQALVICPTRELADQVARQLRALGTGLSNLKISLLCGGMALEPQLASLEHDPHVVVGTPGRLQELLVKRALHLARLRVLVLDEADRMLDMGFEDAIRDIVKRTPATRQGLLFSATFPEPIRVLAQAFLKTPVELSADVAEAAPAIEQHLVEIDPAQRQTVLAGLLARHAPTAAIVFCNQRKDADEVAQSLRHFGFSALALHGDLEQRDREEVLVRFANGSANVLVASDVAARGLDVDIVDLVVNYDLPSDPETYTHRIGRTGRAGRSGQAISLCAPRDLPRLERIEEQRGAPLPRLRPASAPKPGSAPPAPMATLRIDGGKTDKLRPGDILGALTGDAGLQAAAIGKIAIFPTRSYVAIARGQARKALTRLSEGRIKNRRFRVREI